MGQSTGAIARSPFRTHPGAPPPHLAGRASLLHAWRDNLAGDYGEFGYPEIMLYGPRGSGKTVLLTEMESIASDDGCLVASTSVAHMQKTSREFADHLLSGLEPDSYPVASTKTTGVSGKLKLGAANVGGDLMETEETTHKPPGDFPLAARLEQVARRAPLVITVDEGHDTKTQEQRDMLRELTSVVQDLVRKKESQRVPVCLVIAGTPGLPETLSQCGTYTGRYERIGCGLLDADSAKEAIQEPLAKREWRLGEPNSRLRIDEDALDFAVQDSGCFPHFLQLWGDALWRYARDRQQDQLTMHDMEAVRDAVNSKRTNQYEERAAEIMHDPDVLAAAYAAGWCFAQREATGDAQFVSSHAITLAIRHALSNQYAAEKQRAAAAEDCLKKLTARGFFWRPPGVASCTPGIPSFIGHASKLCVAMHGVPEAMRDVGKLTEQIARPPPDSAALEMTRMHAPSLEQHGGGIGDD